MEAASFVGPLSTPFNTFLKRINTNREPLNYVET